MAKIKKTKKIKAKKMWKIILKLILGKFKGVMIMIEKTKDKTILIKIENGKEIEEHYIKESEYEKVVEKANKLFNNLNELNNQLREQDSVIKQKDFTIKEQDSTIKEKEKELDKTRREAIDKIVSKQEELESMQKAFGFDILEYYKNLALEIKESLKFKEENPAFILEANNNLHNIYNLIKDYAKKDISNSNIEGLRELFERLYTFKFKDGGERYSTDIGERFDSTTSFSLNGKSQGKIKQIILKGCKEIPIAKSLVVVE